MASGSLTLGTATASRALVTEQAALDLDTSQADRQQRDLQVWVPDTLVVTAGMRCNLTSVTGDPTLAGKHGTVIAVERDALRASRRFTLRLGNDT
jgi:hypothetical protein